MLRIPYTALLTTEDVLKDKLSDGPRQRDYNILEFFDCSALGAG